MKCTICNELVSVCTMVGSLDPNSEGPMHYHCWQSIQDGKAADEAIEADADYKPAFDAAIEVVPEPMCDRWRCGNFKNKPCDCKPKEA